MAYKPNTGGPLNGLNGKSGVSAPENSVYSTGLVKFHKPKSHEELVQLIKSHQFGSCECGISSKGTIEDFGKNLYEAQLKHWGQYEFTLKECIQWEFDLFVGQTMRGALQEKQAITELVATLDSLYVIELSEEYIDTELRVDLVIYKDAQILCGIQVKPESAKYVRESIHWRNQYGQSCFGYPVLTLYYHYDSGEFLNLAQVVQEVKKLG